MHFCLPSYSVPERPLLLLLFSYSDRKQCKEFSEDKQSSNDPLLVDTHLQTIGLLTDQLTVYADGSATTGTRGYGGGVIVT